MKRATLYAATATTWAATLVGATGWHMANLFSPHTGKLFMAAVFLTTFAWQATIAYREKVARLLLDIDKVQKRHDHAVTNYMPMTMQTTRDQLAKLRSELDTLRAA